MEAGIKDEKATNSILEAEGICFSYDNGYDVFENINVEAESGKFIAIIGPSGIGKSTLLRIIGGFLKPDRGTVRLMGKVLYEPTPEVALIHQSIVTFPWMNAEENVMLSMKTKEMSRDEMEAKARESLSRVGLDGFEDLYPKEMSGGMRQRVAIARAFAANPYVFLMDEPFAHLDELTAEGLRQDIYNILFSGETPLKSVIMVSHNLTEVLELADEIYILNNIPATVVGKVQVTMPRPRNPRSDGFNANLDMLYSYLTPPRKKK
jgi:NitT/TauT family transport system ATP-binding protein